ncbi:MAG: 1-acyl-sn-glycerol-3-phosphate acyltransferase [Siculibacillus sp.]|nr:1-acyl-sn-glycerol-3-phosphate acyltransferase [Siculibacillus sp.]
MKRISLVVRSILFHLAAVLLVVVFSPLSPLLVVSGGRHASRLVLAYLRVLRHLLRWICGIDHRIEGLEHLPPAPYLLASRHESAWEVMFFPLFFDDPAAFAKQEIFSYPLGGLIARRTGQIRIDRGGDLAGLRTAFDEARRTIATGRSVLIFPSGTRHVEGRDRVLPGVGALYDLLRIPCVPVVLDSGRCWPPDSWLKHPGMIHVRIGEPIPPGLDRREFADVLRRRLVPSDAATPSLAMETAAVPAVGARDGH